MCSMMCHAQNRAKLNMNLTPKTLDNSFNTLPIIWFNLLELIEFLWKFKFRKCIFIGLGSYETYIGTFENLPTFLL